jgi:LmbE family N-acetylglucosaminyl deacetylase
MNVLVIAAHPDDEVLGCGGTITRLAREGHMVSLAILGEGITSRYSLREDADDSQVSALHECSHAAAELLGVADPRIFELPDNRFDTVPLLDIVKIIEGLIGQVSPECIFTHNSSDLNLDHSIINRATMIATRPQGNTPVTKVLAYEVPSSTEWAFQTIQPTFQPNVFVDISGTLGIKLKAMQAYDSENRQFPHPRSPEALQAIARRWGSVSGLEAAEAFQLIRYCKR